MLEVIAGTGDHVTTEVSAFRPYCEEGKLVDVDMWMTVLSLCTVFWSHLSPLGIDLLPAMEFDYTLITQRVKPVYLNTGFSPEIISRRVRSRHN